MPELPWVLNGLIYDINGSTAVSGAAVRVTNIRSGEEQSATSAADGSYTFTFTSYQNEDLLMVEAKLTVSDMMIKYGINSTTIDTALPGKTLNITLDKYVDKAVHDIILRKPFQERQDLIYSPQFRAFRVLPVGFENIQSIFTRDGNNLVTTIEEFDGIHTKVTTITRDANNYITGISERVK